MAPVLSGQKIATSIKTPTSSLKPPKTKGVAVVSDYNPFLFFATFIFKQVGPALALP
jgi:hypothetical protein